MSLLIKNIYISMCLKYTTWRKYTFSDLVSQANFPVTYSFHHSHHPKFLEVVLSSDEGKRAD